ncbi:hypothetical protein [Arthrobacter sp. A5]|uniref:hypothetical protein n=1 Tax=Arthrobacter sp. A5 TaxID=576926 RepID=UPI003DA82056
MNALDRRSWPATLPPVAYVLDQGLDLTYGLSPEGGSTGAHQRTRSTESEPADHLQLIRNAGTTRRGYFLRAETMHGFFTDLELNPSQRRQDLAFHQMSHGESFLELVIDRFRGPGFWLLDEPESALSFSGCLALLSISTSSLGTAASLSAEGSTTDTEMRLQPPLRADDFGKGQPCACLARNRYRTKYGFTLG